MPFTWPNLRIFSYCLSRWRSATPLARPHCRDVLKCQGVTPGGDTNGSGDLQQAPNEKALGSRPGNLLHIENGHWVCWFTHSNWWCSLIFHSYVNVYERVSRSSRTLGENISLRHNSVFSFKSVVPFNNDTQNSQNRTSKKMDRTPQPSVSTAERLLDHDMAW